MDERLLKLTRDDGEISRDQPRSADISRGGLTRQVTVVDPREMTARRLGRKWERGLYFRTEPLQAPHR